MKMLDPLAWLLSEQAWRVRNLWASFSLRRSLLSARASESFDGAKTRGRIVRWLARRAVPALLFTLVGYSLVELASWAGRQSGIPALVWSGATVEGDTYRDLVAAGVGASASLLGLYFATVGVVASTVYVSAPVSIRGLFVNEPSGTVYVRGVVRSLVFGVVLLSLASIGHDPSRLVIAVFSLLTLNAVLRLMILGGRIFNFFDPTALAGPLSSKLIRSAKSASRGRGALDKGTQLAARTTAEEALRTYFDLAVLLEDRKSRTANGPREVARQLIRATIVYASLKPGIPTESMWWERKAAHPNWFTVDATRLNMALATATGIYPELVPNRLWVEESVADTLRLAIAETYRTGGSTSALVLAKNMAELARNLARRAQVTEALVIERVWMDQVAEMIRGEDSSPRGKDLNRLAAAEQSVMPLIEVWLGYVQGTTVLARLDLQGLVHRAAGSSSSTYGHSLPPQTVIDLEHFRTRAREERRAEGRIVTPDWWFGHFLARSISAHVNQGFAAIRSEVELSAGSVNTHIEAEDYAAATVVLLANLELVHRLENRLPEVIESMKTLASHRNSSTGVSEWPSFPKDVAWIGELRDVALTKLAACLPHLRVDAHNATRPDLHGQAYQTLYDATFQALLQGEGSLATLLFSALLQEVQPTGSRLARDVKSVDPSAQIAYVLEPFIGAMELSGLADLMQEVDRTGVWSDFKAIWEKHVLGTAPEVTALPYFLAWQAVDSALFKGAPGLARTNREQLVRRTLQGKGIAVGRHDRASQATDRRSVIVESFTNSYGLLELADLFVVDFLMTHLPKDTPLPSRAAGFARRLNRPKGSKPKSRGRANP